MYIESCERKRCTPLTCRHLSCALHTQHLFNYSINIVVCNYTTDLTGTHSGTCSTHPGREHTQFSHTLVCDCFIMSGTSHVCVLLLTCSQWCLPPVLPTSQRPIFLSVEPSRLLNIERKQSDGGGTGWGVQISSFAFIRACGLITLYLNLIPCCE